MSELADFELGLEKDGAGANLDESSQAGTYSRKMTISLTRALEVSGHGKYRHTRGYLWIVMLMMTLSIDVGCHNLWHDARQLG